jgi:hypothetical protein
MARIVVEFVTNETTHQDGKQKSWGTWDLRVTAGLDENPGEVLSEALERVESSLSTIPAKKCYPRFGHVPDGLLGELHILPGI